MNRKVREAVRKHADLLTRWTDCLMEEFLDYHWLLPYPDINGTLISTAKKTRARQWWSIDRDAATKRWVWARNKARPGRPGPYPRTLQMSVEELTIYLDRLATPGGSGDC
jgi:hypothetical protein